MRIVDRIAEIGAPRGFRGFVPTMGALHEGHLSLIRTAKAECDEVGVSIFVNPTQFGPNEDFAKYPRTLDEDLAKCESAGADFVFAPSVEEMYSKNAVTVSVKGVTERWEGAVRPTHFDGVATVVLKLLLLSQCQAAFFGLKDLQQCLTIKSLCDGLSVPVRLRFCPTVREADGLAMSSRNRYLSASERSAASLLYNSLCNLAKTLPGTQSVDDWERELALSAAKIAKSGFKLDYLETVSVDGMMPIREAIGQYALIIAAKIGSTRLIDNVLMGEELQEVLPITRNAV